MSTVPTNTLPMKVESGDPTIVRFEHQGEKYVVRIQTAVMAIWPTGGIDVNGVPNINVNMAPVITVTKEPKAVKVS